jgi:hypothetical protein
MGDMTELQSNSIMAANIAEVLVGMSDGVYSFEILKNVKEMQSAAKQKMASYISDIDKSFLTPQEMIYFSSYAESFRIICSTQIKMKDFFLN